MNKIISNRIGKALSLADIRRKPLGAIVSEGLSSRPKDNLWAICLNEGCQFTVVVPERTIDRYCTQCKTPSVADVLTLCVIDEKSVPTMFLDELKNTRSR